MAVKNCIKYSLFFFNFLSGICGCIILGVSIYIKVSNDRDLTGEITSPTADLLLAIGVITMIFGFLGCCGAIRESKCMLLLFFSGLLLVFVFLLASGILVVLLKEKSKQLIMKKMTELSPLSNATEEVWTMVQALEKQGKCCGLVKGPTDWGTVVPASCDCKDKSAPCEMFGERELYKTPCTELLETFIEQHLTVILGVPFALAVLMILGMTFAMILYCQVGRTETATA
ncbi:tetraspanin-8-like [Scleropages formosus]|uniref:Tetraspanin n=1 Tax=Scleropages formosus TaxID=113540 RepID=A0A8C9S3X4_SCLFO|nr:tetraspanin-8 [Scleropages formosus]